MGSGCSCVCYNDDWPRELEEIFESPEEMSPGAIIPGMSRLIWGVE